MRTRNRIAMILAAVGIVLIAVAFVVGLDSVPVLSVGGPGRMTREEAQLDGPVTAVKADLDVGSLVIQVGEGSETHLTYPVAEHPERYTFTYALNDGVIELADRWHQRVQISLPWDNLGNEERTAILTLPAGTDLETLDLDLDMGSIELSGVQAGDTMLKINMGSALVNNSHLGRLDGDLDMGALEMQEVQLSDGSRIRLAMGDISGRVTLRGVIDIAADMGSVDLKLLDTEPYAYDLETEMGEITVAGRSSSGRANYSNEEAVAELVVHVDMGSIRID